MEDRTMQVVLAKDEKVLFTEATVYDIEQEKELNREVGRVPVEADYHGSYLAVGHVGCGSHERASKGFVPTFSLEG